MSGVRFLIDGLPRTGSTSLAGLLTCHKDISCIVEPFHPSRYSGQYRRQIRDIASLRETLNLIWLRWTGIKHIWEAEHIWPFEKLPELNDEIVLYAPAVVSIERRNLLQRYVSTMLSRSIRFWIGKRAEFLKRMEVVGFPELCVDHARKSIEIDKAAIASRRRLLSSHLAVMFVSYEGLFGPRVSDFDRIDKVNEIVRFLGYDALRAGDTLTPEWKSFSDPEHAKWATQEVYERIPGILELENKVGADSTGWLFR